MNQIMKILVILIVFALDQEGRSQPYSHCEKGFVHRSYVGEIRHARSQEGWCSDSDIWVVQLDCGVTYWAWNLAPEFRKEGKMVRLWAYPSAAKKLCVIDGNPIKLVSYDYISSFYPWEFP